MGGEAEPIDTGNYQVVGRMGAEVVVMAPRARMTPREALTHAAWLVALAEDDAGVPFADVLRAVRST